MLASACESSGDSLTKEQHLFPQGRGAFPYKGYMGRCHRIGYSFWPLCPQQGLEMFRKGYSCKTTLYCLVHVIQSNPKLFIYQI